MLENALKTYIPSFSEVGIFLIYTRLSITLWDLFQLSHHRHAFNHAPGEELWGTHGYSYGFFLNFPKPEQMGRGKWTATIIHLTTSCSPVSERKNADWAGCGPDWLFLWIRSEKIPTCFLVSFFHILSIKSTRLLLCHWELAVWAIINIFFFNMVFSHQYSPIAVRIPTES